MSDSSVEEIQVAIDNHPYLNWLGLEIQTIDTGETTLTIPYEEKLANPGGPQGLHGGVSSAVLDVAGAIAVASTCDDPASMLGQGSISTMDLNVSYLRPATQLLFVESEAIYIGDSTGVARIVGHQGEQENIVAGRGTYRLF